MGWPTKKYPCPCCGERTLLEKPPGSFDICPVCGWEDDKVQFESRDFRGGANSVSLREAQENFRRFGRAKPGVLSQIRKRINLLLAKDRRHG